VTTRPVLRWHGGKWKLAEWIIAHFRRAAIADTHPKGGDAKQAPSSMSGGGGEANRQNSVPIGTPCDWCNNLSTKTICEHCGWRGYA
jgi:hypothetical protein